MNELDIEAIADALRAGRLVLKPIEQNGQIKYFALVPNDQPQPADDRFPPTLDIDPRRTRPL